MQSGEGDNSQRWRRMEVKLDLLDQRLTRQEGEIFNLREQHREDVKALREEINVLKSAKRKREEDNRRAIIPRSAPRLSHPSPRISHSAPLSRSEPLFFVNEHELLSEHELSSKLSDVGKRCYSKYGIGEVQVSDEDMDLLQAIEKKIPAGKRRDLANGHSISNLQR